MIENVQPCEYYKSRKMKYNPDLHDRQGEHWTEDEKEYLINWYSKIGLEEMSLALGRTESTISSQVNRYRKRGLMPYSEPSKIPRQLHSDNRRVTKKERGLAI